MLLFASSHGLPRRAAPSNDAKGRILLLMSGRSALAPYSEQHIFFTFFVIARKTQNVIGHEENVVKTQIQGIVHE